jgi:hypothetical protein
MRLSDITRRIEEVRLLVEGRGGPLGIALMEFTRLINSKIKWALGGGLAVSVYSEPRATQDIDIFLGGEQDLQRIIPLVNKSFRLIRPHALRHKKLGIEIELLTPEFLKIQSDSIRRVLDVALSYEGIPILSKEGLIYLKLKAGRHQDLADIEKLLESGPVDLSIFPLNDKEQQLLASCKKDKHLKE